MDLLKFIIYDISLNFILIGGTLMQNIVQDIVHYLLPRVFSAVVSFQAIHSDISGANRFDPIDIAPYGGQVLITIRSDQNIILDSDTTD